MKLRHRKVHRLAWLLLGPALVLLVVLGSNSQRDATPVNDSIAHIDKAVPLQ